MRVLPAAIERLRQPLPLHDRLQENIGGTDCRPSGDRSVPEALVYGIGDVHGMDDLLADLLAAIEADATDRNLAATVVFLGDVVNEARSRGRCSTVWWPDRLDRVTAGSCFAATTSS